MNQPTQSDWYQQMAAAMKKRDHAIKMIDRWEAAQTAAEVEIHDLFQAATQTEASTEQE